MSKNETEVDDELLEKVKRAKALKGGRYIGANTKGRAVILRGMYDKGFTGWSGIVEIMILRSESKDPANDKPDEVGAKVGMVFKLNDEGKKGEMAHNNATTLQAALFNAQELGEEDRLTTFACLFPPKLKKDKTPNPLYTAQKLRGYEFEFDTSVKGEGKDRKSFPKPLPTDNPPEKVAERRAQLDKEHPLPK